MTDKSKDHGWDKTDLDSPVLLVPEADTAQAMFRAFFDQSLSFSALLSPQGKLLEVNRLALRSSGFTRDQVVGKLFWDCGWWNPSADVQAGIQDAVLQAAQGRASSRETPYYIADGSKRAVAVSMSAVRNDQQEVIAVAASGIDVTARSLAESALQSAHDSFRHLVANSPFGVYTVDADFRLNLVSVGALPTFVNVEPLLGADFSDVLRTLWPEPFATEVIGHFRHTMATGEPYQSRRTVELRSDISEVASYDWKIEQVTLPDGRHGVVCYFYDLSEREQFEAKILEQDRQKDEFLSTLAHELRNPLAAIGNAMALLRLKNSVAADSAFGFDIIERQTGQLVRMVDDLLDLNRIHAGKIILQVAWAPLTQVVAMATETHRSLFEERHHELTVSMPDIAVEVQCDKDRLAQVFGNLLQNAAKYTDKHGNIKLLVDVSGPSLTVQIIDNGRGLAAQDVETIFDMFSQVQQNGVSRVDGLGIGLSLSKRLVELHGGQITVRSDGLNHGATFQVELPIPIRPEASKQETAAEPRLVGGVGRRILVAEDKPDAAEALAQVLEVLGHEVLLVHDGAAAVAAVTEFEPDAILLDIDMPVLDGYQACKKIRQLAGADKLLLIALTGYGQHQDVHQAQQVGFDHHFVKPLDFTRLGQVLETHALGSS